MTKKRRKIFKMSALGLFAGATLFVSTAALCLVPNSPQAKDATSSPALTNDTLSAPTNYLAPISSTPSSFAATNSAVTYVNINPDANIYNFAIFNHLLNALITIINNNSTSTPVTAYTKIFGNFIANKQTLPEINSASLAYYNSVSYDSQHNTTTIKKNYVLTLTFAADVTTGDFISGDTNPWIYQAPTDNTPGNTATFLFNFNQANLILFNLADASGASLSSLADDDLVLNSLLFATSSNTTGLISTSGTNAALDLTSLTLTPSSSGALSVHLHLAGTTSNIYHESTKPQNGWLNLPLNLDVANSLFPNDDALIQSYELGSTASGQATGKTYQGDDDDIKALTYTSYTPPSNDSAPVQTFYINLQQASGLSHLFLTQKFLTTYANDAEEITNPIIVNTLSNLIFGTASPYRITSFTIARTTNNNNFAIQSLTLSNLNVTDGTQFINPLVTANGYGGNLTTTNWHTINLAANNTVYYQFVLTNALQEQTSASVTPSSSTVEASSETSSTQEKAMTAYSVQTSLETYTHGVTSFVLADPDIVSSSYTFSYSGNSTDAFKTTLTVNGIVYNVTAYNLTTDNALSQSGSDLNQVTVTSGDTFVYTQLWQTNGTIACGYLGPGETASGKKAQIFIEVDNAANGQISDSPVYPNLPTSTTSISIALPGSSDFWVNYFKTHTTPDSVSYGLLDYILAQVFSASPVLFQTFNLATTGTTILQQVLKAIWSVFDSSTWSTPVRFTLNFGDTTLGTTSSVTFSFTATANKNDVLRGRATLANLTSQTAATPSLYQSIGNMARISTLGVYNDYYNAITPSSTDYSPAFNFSQFVAALTNSSSAEVDSAQITDFASLVFQALNVSLTGSSIPSIDGGTVVSLVLSPSQQEITQITVLSNGKLYTLNLTVGYGQISNGYLINYANVTDAADFHAWFNTWVKVSGYVFDSGLFSTLSGNSLTFAANGVTFSNHTYSTYDQKTQTFGTQQVFTQGATGNFGDGTWCSWAVLSDFLSTIYHAYAENTSTGTIFQNITTLALNGLPLDASASTVVSSLLSWFPNLTSLQIENCGLSGALDFNNLTNVLTNGDLSVHLKYLNLDNNNLTSLILPNNLVAASAANNQLTSVSAGAAGLYYLALPSQFLDLSDNNLTTLPPITSAAGSFPYVLNFANNNLTTITLTNSLGGDDSYTPSETNYLPFGTNTITYTATGSNTTYNYTLNLSHNALVSLNVDAGVLNTETWTSNGLNNYTIEQNEQPNGGTNTLSLYSTLNYSGQNANSVLMLTNISSADGGQSNVYQPTNVSTSGVANPLAASGVNSQYGLSLATLSDGFASDTTVGAPEYLKGTESTGIINQTTYNIELDNTSDLAATINNASSNALWMLNPTNLQSATLTIGNADYSSSVSWQTLNNVYAGTVPYNAYCLYRMLTANDEQGILNNFLSLKALFAAGFNLQNQPLVQSNITDWTSALEATGVSLTGADAFGSAGNYITATSNGDIVIYNADNNPNGVCYVVKATNLSVSSQPFATLTIQSGSSYFHIRLVLTNTPTTLDLPERNTSGTGPGFNNEIQVQNVNQIDVNNIWSLNGTSGFYNLGLGGIVTPLATNPFSMGVNATLWDKFLNIDYGNNLTLSSVLSDIASSSSPDQSVTMTQVYNYLKNVSRQTLQTFSNNFYHLLEEEGMIKYGQVYSLYGTFDQATNNFTLSDTFLNSSLTFSSPAASQGWVYGVNNNAGLSTDLEYPNTQDTSGFYQSSVWANFVNLTANFGTSKDPLNETVGAYLYHQGNWDYEMPSANNSVFNNKTVKTAYDEILTLYNLGTNLSQTQFNAEIANDFPILNSSASTQNLFKVFTYDDGTISAVYYLYTNLSSNETLALNLTYLNAFQNVANSTGNYLFRLSVYGAGLFTNLALFNNTANLLETMNTSIQTNSVAGTNTWADLETAESENLIAEAVYNNENVIGGTTSANWVPVQNYNQIIQTENHDTFIDSLIYGVIIAVVLGLVIGYGSYALVKRQKNKERKTARFSNLVKKKNSALANEIKNLDEEDW